VTDANPVPVRRLGRTDVRVTTLGFGGGPIGWLDAPNAEATADATLAAAVHGGLRYLDTAPFYGHGRSESRIGTFLARHPRPEVVLSTKVGRLIRPGDRDPVVFDYSRDGALRSVEESLRRLRRERIDILLVHDIDRYTHGDDQPRRYQEACDGAWRALADMRAEGLVAAIGIGVNECRVCERLAHDLDPDVFLLAGRFTLLEQTAAESLLPLCERRGIGVIIGGPFNSGILVTGDTPDAQFQYAPAPADIRAKVRHLAAVCDSHGIPLAAAALQFPLLSPVVGSVIPGVSRPEELEAATAWASLPIPQGLWSDLRAEGLIMT
jgi:D-threo-aldose 1-dehydrogenase